MTDLELLNTEEAAKGLGMAPQTLINMRATGRGPAYVKIGGRVRYRLKDLEEYLEARKVVPAGEQAARLAEQVRTAEQGTVAQ